MDYLMSNQPQRMGLAFFVPGKPITQGSKTTGVSKNGRRYVRESSKYLKAWRKAIHDMALHRLNDPISVPVRVSMHFFFKRPKSHYKTGYELTKAGLAQPIPKRDIDKLARAVNDSLVTAGVLKDDSLVYDLHQVKLWTTLAGAEGVKIKIEWSNT